MRDIQEIKADKRLQIVEWYGEHGFLAWLISPYKPRQFAIVASWNNGWEHVSASTKVRCPTWDEMCRIKNIFWGGMNVSYSITRLKTSM